MSEEERPPLPPMHEATLDDAGLDALMADLSGAAEVLEVRVKGGAERHAQGAELGPALARLRRGEVRAVQVRYRFDGHDWFDSLWRIGGDYRLVRMRAQWPPD